MKRDVAKLYQSLLLDHAKQPRYPDRRPDPGSAVERNNPACGDIVRLSMKVVAGEVRDLRLHLQACAIATASSSMMYELVSGATLEALPALRERIEHMVRTGDVEDGESTDARALASVAEFPMRISCALLPWLALDDAISTV